MKANGNFSKFEAWQEARLNDEVGQGYGAFTYSIREKDMIIKYVKNQKEHHRTETFYDEFKRLLIENGIEFDEKYLLCWCPAFKPFLGCSILYDSSFSVSSTHGY